MSIDTLNIKAEPKDINKRIDVLLREKTNLSRSRIQELIRQGNLKKAQIVINDCDYTVKLDDIYSLTIPAPISSHMQETNIDLDIVYEDDDLAVINKQAGLTVHPGAGNKNNTLANALLYHFKGSLSGIGGVERPGIVHRLDKNTSGLMIIAKNDSSHNKLSAAIKERKVKRRYLAFCYQIPKPISGVINEKIGRHPVNRVKMMVVNKNSKEAITHYEVKESYLNGKASLVECRLQTGRTHQIRVHLEHINSPVIGDILYGVKQRSKNIKAFPEEIINYIATLNRHALHSYYLSFAHPISEQVLEFTIDLPKELIQLKQLLEDA